jgi:hypothetical protein
MTPRAVLSMSRECIRQRNEQRAREQIQSLVDAAAKPVTVTWLDETHAEIVDADGNTAHRLQWLCQGVSGIDGWTRAVVGAVEISAKRGTR